MGGLLAVFGEKKYMNDVLLETRGLVKYFPLTKGLIFAREIGSVKAVNDVSFDIRKGGTFGLVGESGCGKTTVAKLILLLEKITKGSIKLNGRKIDMMRGVELRDYKRSVQAIFQDPYSSLNPRMRVGEIIGEPVDIHGIFPTKASRDQRITEVLEIVGLRDTSARLYPHEFSGGQRQRIALARALSLKPSLIILDEPVSALDVSIRAQILNLFKNIQKDTGVSYLLIAHDLAVVKHMSEVVGVMYLGKIVEMAQSRELYTNPVHPYTKALLAAVPIPDPELRFKKGSLSGEVPSPLNPPSGCQFHPRCNKAKPICTNDPPVFKEVSPGHRAACHFID
jgi:oligopeptide transport system ATP-binding protein